MMANLQTVSFDTETTGLNLYQGDRLFAFSTCSEDFHQVGVLRRDREAVRFWERLRGLWADPTVTKVMHNSKFDLTATMLLGVDIPWGCPIHDTMIMSKLLRSNAPSHGLKELGLELADIPTDDEKEVLKAIGDTRDYSRCPEHIMDRYQRGDAERTMLLFQFFWPKIQKDPRLLALYKLEIDLIWATIRIERRGVMLCPRSMERLEGWLAGEIGRINTTFPPGVNPDRKDALAAWLVGLGYPMNGRTATGKISTAKTELIDLWKQFPERPEVENSLRWRSYSKGFAIIQNYRDHADKEGVVHSSINTYGAHTGRESSERPNLQNVSKTINPQNPFPVPARSCFRPRVGFVNFHIDYAGIEARLLINASGDEESIKVIREGGDHHVEVARIFFSDLWEKITEKYDLTGTLTPSGFCRWDVLAPRIKDKADKDAIKGYRYVAKTINFATPYGAGVGKVIGILAYCYPGDVVRKRFDTYRQRFPRYVGLNRIMASCAAKVGFIETVFGRRINVNPSKAYVAVNFHIQGTAADILKKAQVRVDRYLAEETGDSWGILMPVHDELIIEAPRQDLPQAPRILRGVRELMIDFPEFEIPMEVEVQISTLNWSVVKPFEIMERKEA